MHENERRYKCKWVGCEYACNTSCNLRKHAMIHERKVASGSTSATPTVNPSHSLNPQQMDMAKHFDPNHSVGETSVSTTPTNMNLLTMPSPAVTPQNASQCSSPALSTISYHSPTPPALGSNHFNSIIHTQHHQQQQPMDEMVHKQPVFPGHQMLSNVSVDPASMLFQSRPVIQHSTGNLSTTTENLQSSTSEMPNQHFAF